MNPYLEDRFSYAGLQDLSYPQKGEFYRRYVYSDLIKDTSPSRVVSGLYDLFKKESCFDNHQVYEASISLTPVDGPDDFSCYPENGIQIHFSKKVMTFDNWWLNIIKYVDSLHVKITFGVLWTFNDEKNIAPRNVPAKVRVQVLDRDNSTCQLCGATRADGAKLHVDHIVPLSKGGTNELDNLQTLCQDCNLGKGNSTDLNMVKRKLEEGCSDE